IEAPEAVGRGPVAYHGLAEFTPAGPAGADVGDRPGHHAGAEVQDRPAPARLADRRAVVHFAGIHRDDVARPGLYRPASAVRFLRAARDQADAEMFVGVAREGVPRVGLDGLDARQGAGPPRELAARHAATRARRRTRPGGPRWRPARPAARASVRPAAGRAPERPPGPPPG